MKISFLSTLPEEEWERYQMELEGKTGATWSRVDFMEKSWDVIRRYGTQSIMKVGLNQPIMREVLEKIVDSMESDVLTESVTEDSADDQQGTKKLLVRRAKKGLKRLKGKTGSRVVNQRVVKSKAKTVVTSLISTGRSSESGQGDGATPAGGEKENLIPPMLLAGLTITATRSKKTARTLADTKLEMEIISQCGSGGHEDEWVKMPFALSGSWWIVSPLLFWENTIKIIRQKGVECEMNFLRALLELYQDIPMIVPSKESNDMESYRKLEEVRRYSNKELKVSRELIEAVRRQKEFATLGKLKSFQYVSGIPGMAYNPFMNEEAREAYFDYEQITVLNFWVERIKEIGMLMVEQPKLGIILEERVVEPSIPELKGQVSFDCGS